MQVHCSLPFNRIKIDADGKYQSCCHQSEYYGNILTDDISLEDAFKNRLLLEVKNSGLTTKLHSMCNNNRCPLYSMGDKLTRGSEVFLEKYPIDIEISLPSTWCNIGGLKPTPDTACIMCPRSSMEYMKWQPKEDYTDKIIEKVKPLMPYIKTLNIQGISEPFYKNKLFDIFDTLSFKDHNNHIFFWTFSNGSIFNDKIQDRFLKYVKHSVIGFSLDAATPETYKKIRRIDYQKTIDNIGLYFKKIDNINNSAFISYNINMINLHEMEEMVIFAHNIGANSAQFTLTFISSDEKISPDLICNSKNWELFWKGQQLAIEMGKKLNYKVEFYVPFHKGYLK